MATITVGKSCRFINSAVRQVTKSNFAATIPQIKSHIEKSDFVSISSRKTGSFSSHPWRNLLPIDTPQTSYLKSKLSASTFNLLHFSICPFSIRDSKLIAFPYNFLLFPTFENTFSFSCQTSFLTCLAKQDFDFNAWVYDGIPYLSRVQESRARERMHAFGFSSQTLSVADSVFKERIKSRVSHWRNACRDRTREGKDESFVQSLRKLVLGGDDYGSRPGISIDICSEKQVQLVFQTVEQISDDLVPIVIAADKNGGLPKAVRVVLVSSEEDKQVLLREVQEVEDEENLKYSGFRQVIDLISGSHKTVVAHNCLHEFSFIHEKFVGPLPATLPEFKCSLKLVFPNVIDVNDLLKEFGSLRKAKNIESALSYLKRRYFVPIEIEVPEQVEDGNKSHGNNVLKIAFLFAKLNMLLKNAPVEDYANIFNPGYLTLYEPGGDGDESGWWIDSTRRVGTDNILFLWGFGGTSSAMELKRRLLQIHSVFSEEFDVHLVDKTCAVVVFERSDSAETLLKGMSSVDTVSGVLREMVVEGLRAAGYDAYKKVCMLGLWEGDLADSLEIALAETVEELCSLSTTKSNEIEWNNDMMIDLNDL